MGKKSDKKKNPFEVERYFASDGRPANVGKESTADFSIDGKSFHYRDPRNPESNDYAIAQRSGDNGSAEDNVSKNAYEYTNPLYDYSYGQVRDAAKELDISNVNSQEEVDQLLKQVRGENTPKAEEFKDDFIKEKVKPKKPVYGPKKSFTYSPDTQAAFDREEERTAQYNSQPSSSSQTSSAAQIEPFVTTDFKSQIKKSIKPNLAYSLDNAAETLREKFMGQS